MENKAKIDPKRFEIIRAYQKQQFIDGSMNLKKVESAVKQENQLKRKRRFTRLQ